MTLTYKMIDEIITEMFGEPDPATSFLGGFILDHENLQAFAARILAASSVTTNLSRGGCGKERAQTSYGYWEMTGPK